MLLAGTMFERQRDKLNKNKSEDLNLCPIKQCRFESDIIETFKTVGG